MVLANNGKSREGLNGKLYGSGPDPFPPPRNKRERVGYARLTEKEWNIPEFHDCPRYNIIINTMATTGELYHFFSR